MRDENLTRLSPARCKYLNRLGKYTSPNQMKVYFNGLRSLRKATEAASLLKLRLTSFIRKPLIAGFTPTTQYLRQQC
ncbi:MAG: hypothetical protein EOO61_03475 [Hymenobacter sp.]|nr:MAG: hypothetical protein EOO61_03475 [Hymenobacter sp.]